MSNQNFFQANETIHFVLFNKHISTDGIVFYDVSLTKSRTAIVFGKAITSIATTSGIQEINQKDFDIFIKELKAKNIPFTIL